MGRVPGRPRGATEPGPVPGRSGLAQGVGVSGLNPKAPLLFMALLSQFTEPEDGWPMGARIATPGLVHTASCAVVYLCVGLLARALLGARPAAARAVTRVPGAAMVVIGVVLLVDRLAV
ncbi:LysE family transporter [Nocardiopsis sp. EMB25]|uniref:LysE family translocator n=1 Tax=Nocardiopsis sp. EMB25 TaxID=2835867 RepID=UPI0022846D47|nr:LysE family transporter [Nocardiopsis sp. EMB25]MCY9783417.1 LysE family transporter [Nocardiopsis sp. EMB25]